MLGSQNPNALSTAGMSSLGGMFNMDSLQQDEETNPEKKREELKKLAKETIADSNGASSGTSSYNLQQQNKPQKQSQSSYKSNISTITPTNASSMTTSFSANNKLKTTATPNEEGLTVTLGVSN